MNRLRNVVKKMIIEDIRRDLNREKENKKKGR
jgi:hypothetical protein